MKSVLIIGMGKFGHHLCDYLIEMGNDIMLVDILEERVSDMVYKVNNVQIGDCTDPAVVKSIGVGDFDLVFVCIGENFQASLEVTDMVKTMGAKYVISKATRDVHAKFLLKNGADEIIYPDKDIAERYAKRCSVDKVFDYIELDDTNSMYEITAPEAWVGRSIIDLDVRKSYNIYIIGIRKEGKMEVLPGPKHVINKDEHLVIIGTKENVESLI